MGSRCHMLFFFLETANSLFRASGTSLNLKDNLLRREIFLTSLRPGRHRALCRLGQVKGTYLKLCPCCTPSSAPEFGPSRDAGDSGTATCLAVTWRKEGAGISLHGLSHAGGLPTVRGNGMLLWGPTVGQHTGLPDSCFTALLCQRCKTSFAPSLTWL